ncbi:MAG: hypothetical protein IKR57_00840 [Bacilli bacterium]|nr:hypothetical protein [Bacilli bacterium]
MKGKSIISILIGIVLIVIGCILLFGGSSEEKTNNEPENTNVPADTTTPIVLATIYVYDQTGSNVINAMEVKDLTRGNELKGYVDQLKPLTGEEVVNKRITKNVEIKYGNNTIVTIQTGEERYCEYSLDGGITTNMSYMPIGLVDWLNKNVL